MSRSKFTEAMWHQTPVAYQEAVSLDAVQAEWWHDSRPNGGWRLSWSGLADLTDLLKLDAWYFDFSSKEIQPWMLLKLKKHITVPYYIVDNRKHTQLVVFDSKLAVMINLYGEVEKWVASLQA